MLDVVLDYFKKLFKSRLFPITLIYLALFAVAVHQLFVLQIVKGPQIAQENNLKYAKSRDIKSTRGNFFDRNGKLLASNKLSYSVMMDDLTIPDDEYNAIIYKLINIIEKNGDTLDNEFFIRVNDKNEFEFTVQDTALERFKKNAYAYVLGDDKKLTKNQENATAKEVYEFLKNGGDSWTNMFGISDDYSVKDALKIMSVRYAIFCNYPHYMQITVASKVSDNTVAAVIESKAELKGVEIQQQTSRVYEDSEYFANIIGYTGLINSDELEKWEPKGYNSTDVIGKTGLEAKFEQELAGSKGNETVSVNSAGRVIDTVVSKEPVAGNDVYLTIDADLQKNVYKLLEKEITQILLANIVSGMNYGSKGESASDIRIPIFEVYNALINNNIIDIYSFDNADATPLEKSTQVKYLSELDNVEKRLDELLSINSSALNKTAGDMTDFLDYFYEKLTTNNIILKKSIPSNDTTYKAYISGNISLSSFLQYALANNWVDLSVLDIGKKYYSADELYQKLIDYTKDLLKDDDTFNKMIYRKLIFSYKLSGSEICLLLFDQGVLKYNEEEISKLKVGRISSYQFITDKIRSLEITPAMLALEPCSGSVVITDVNTGDVLALVSYPSYNNNLLANKADSKYFSKLLNDKSTPLRNRAVVQRTAPGSTFKMVTSVAVLEEGLTTPEERIRDLGVFDKIKPGPKCHIYPGSHGLVDLPEALKVSCNYFFFEMGWRLSMDGTGKYNEKLGLSRLKKYATLFGLNETSGIELDEAQPEISSQDAVRSAIGQGSNDYTPVQMSRYITTIANRGTCYNLTLLDRITDKDGKTIKNNSATINHQLKDISSTTWDSVFKGMESVVNTPGGSVYNEFHGFGVNVAGKTGTSQISTLYPNNALFVSFAPYNKPEISITTVIPNGYTSHNAAALAKNIYSLYFGLEDAKTLLEGNAAETGTNDTATIE